MTASVTVPTLTTPTAASIGTTTATLGATVTSDGGASLTSRGTVWGTAAAPTGNLLAEGGTAVSAFSHARSGFSVNTLYTYRGYAVNSAGTGYSPDGTFWTLANTPSTPTVNAPTASSLNVAIGSGDGNPSGTAYAIHETTLDKYVQADGSLNTTQVYQTAATWGTKVVTGLSPSTSYTFEVKARNGANVDTSFGPPASASTSASCTTPTIDSTTPVNVTCNGGNDGSITVSASGGSGPYEYSKDNGANWQSGNGFTGLAATTYQIKVRGSDLCTSAATPVTLTQPTAITFSPSQVNVTCNGGNDGSITVNSPAGGSGSGYTYSRDNGANFQAGNQFTGLSANTYQIKVKDGIGCISSASAVTLTETAAIVVNPTSPLTAGSTSVAYSQTFTASGGNGGNTFAVTGGSLPPGLTFTSPTLSGTPTTPGTYNFTVTATDSASCTGNRAYSLTISDAYSHPAAQSLPYSQDFSALVASSTTYPAGWQGWDIGTAPSASFSTAGPSADRALSASSTAATTTGGVHNYSGKIGFLNTGSLDETIALAINTSGSSSIQVTYDIMTIRNPYDGSSNTRINEGTLQYRVGTSGAWTSLTGIEYQNNTTAQTSGTAPQNSQTKTITLPSACNNQSVVELRWASRQVSGVGSRPSFAVDNIVVCALPTTADAGTDQNVCGLAATLAGNTPTSGSGTWTKVSGPGTVTFSAAGATTPGATATVSAYGTYVLRWTIHAATCGDSTDDVQVVYSQQSDAPTVTSPICEGATSVAGTSSEADGTSIQVYDNGGSVGSPATVSSGAWTATVPALAGGHSVTAKATASGKCQSAASSGVTVNYKPVAGTHPTLTTRKSQNLSIVAAKLAAADSDPDAGDTLSVTDVGNATPGGASVALSGGIITYSPGGTAGSGSFDYTLSDNHGCTATVTINVTITDSISGGTSPNVVYGPTIEGGDFVVRFAGHPGYEYTIEYSADANPPWTWKANLTAPATDTGFGIGVFEFRDAVESSGFYRTVYPSYPGP